MNQEILTLQIDGDKKATLDRIAAYVNRDCNSLINDAIDTYLDTYKWQVGEIKQALKEADEGDFATDEEVQATFTRLTHES